VRILADTSVWIAHFRRREPRLQLLLSEGGILMHPAVIGELACGNLARRQQVLSDLQRLPTAATADRADAMFVIESRKLWGKGIGWIDTQLISSALLSGCVLWTYDKHLHKVAATLGIADDFKRSSGAGPKIDGPSRHA